MNELTAANRSARMSSLEIAERTDKLHKNVMRDIRDLIDQGAIDGLNFELVEYQDAKGESRPMYLLDFEATLTLVTGYDAKRRSAVIKRWAALERGEAHPAAAPADHHLLLSVAEGVSRTVELMGQTLERFDARLEQLEQARLPAPAEPAADRPLVPSVAQVAEFVRLGNFRRETAAAVSKEDIFRYYWDFCNQYHLPVYNSSAFFKALYRAVPTARPARIGPRTRALRVVAGLALPGDHRQRFKPSLEVR